MRRVTGMMLLIGAAGWLWAAEQPRLPQVKDFHLNTVLVDNGKPAAIIVAPERDGYGPVAKKLQAAIKEASGAELRVVPDTSFLERRQPGRVALPSPDHPAFAESNMILLGNLMTNCVCAMLYCQEYVNTDAAWPGPGGHLLETVHNPLGKGRNFVCVGGSDLAGVTAAAEALMAKLQPGKTLRLPPLYELKTEQEGPAPLTEEQIAKNLKGLKGKGYRSIGSALTSYGSVFRKWRTPGYGKAFRQVIDLQWPEMDKLKVCDDLRTVKFLPTIWDGIEESPEFTPADREHISNFMYQHALKVPYAHRDVKPSARPHGNNWNAQGSFRAGLYFAKYYPELEIGKLLMERMDRYYQGDLKHWKVAEDCPGYGNITATANLNYALLRPDMSYFWSGNVRKLAEYDVTITTNRGNVAGFGDAGGLSGKYAVVALPIAAWFYRDGGLLWWYKHIGGRPGRYSVDDLKEEPPTQFLGVHVLPLDQWVYDRGKDRPMPVERCFDKISFRDGFEADQQYLLLGGFSYGFHSHPDGNAIITFTDNNKTLLFDDGYMIPEMSEHNTVLVFRDGLGGALPELVELEAKADFPAAGLTRTKVTGYNGVTWARSIVWAKERYFLVLDELLAQVPAEYGFQCIYRTMGEVKLEGHRMVANQDGTELRLVEGMGFTQGLKACHPKHPFGTRLVQSAFSKLAQGERLLFASAFRGAEQSEPLELDIAPQGRQAVTVRDGKGTMLAGVVEAKGPGGLEVIARLFAVSAERAYLLHGKRFRWGKVSVSADQAFNADLDLVAGRGTVETFGPTKLQVGDRKIALQAGTSKITLAGSAAEARRVALEKAHTASAQARAVKAAGEKPGAAQHVSLLWSYGEFEATVDRTVMPGVQVRSSVAPLKPADVDFPIGALEKIRAKNGNVMFPTGKTVRVVLDLGQEVQVRRVIVRSRQLRTFQGGCGCREMAVELSRDNFQTKQAFGTAKETTVPPQNKLMEYAIEGKPAMARQVAFTFTPLTPKHKVYIDSVGVESLLTEQEKLQRGLVLHSLSIGDLDGDGKDETIVGAADSAVYALSPAGRRLWKTQLSSRIYQLAAADVDGDGKGEVAVGCADKRLYLLDNEGKVRWDLAPPPRTYERPGYRGVRPFQGAIKIVFTADLDGDGKREIVIGSGNWRTYVYSCDGKLLYDECNWAHQPTCGDAYDLDGDGYQEIMLGNDYASLHIYNVRDKKIVKVIGTTGHAGPSAVDADDLDGDGTGDIVVGDRGGKIMVVVPWNGKPRTLQVGAPITKVKIADLDGDGKKEALVGAENCYVYCFGADGERRWTKNLGEVPRDIVCGNVAGDKALEIVIGGEDNVVHVWDAAGEERARFRAGRWVRHVALAEVDGDPAYREIVAASDDGHVYALRVGGE